MAAALEPTIRVEEVAAALIAALSTARWPNGSLLVDLHPSVIRHLLVPQVLHQLGLGSTEDLPRCTGSWLSGSAATTNQSEGASHDRTPRT